MNTDSICRNTVLEARLLVRAVVKAGVLSGILMNKAALAFPVMSADEGRGKSFLSAPYKTADKTLSCIVPSYIPSAYV